MNAAQLASLGAPLLPAAAGLLLKVTLLFTAAGALTVLLRRRAAAARHEVWSLTLMAALALTMLAPLAPAIELPLLRPTAAEVGPATRGGTTVSRSRATATPHPPAFPAAPATRAPQPLPAAAPADRSEPFAPAAPALLALALVWAAGALVVLCWCLLGHLGLRRLARSAAPLTGGEWPRLLAEAQAVAGIRRPVALRRSAAVATPLTWGARRPIVLLPADAESWPPQRRRTALLHELAHVARHDYLTQLAGMATCALYWFHPGAWLALRRLRRESERACDDRVLAAGTPADEYAAQLLSVARGAQMLRRGSALLAIGMARPSTLEGRLLAVLDETQSRQTLPARSRMVAALALAVAIVPFAGLEAVARGTLGEPSGELAARAARPSLARGEVAALAVASGGGRGADAMSRARLAASEPSGAGCELDEGASFECALAAAPGELLRLDLETGATVEIRGWDQDRLEMVGQLSARGRDTRATMRRESGGVRLWVGYVGNRGNWSSAHRFLLRVPRRFDVELDSAGGDVTISAVEGRFSGVTGGGKLALSNLRGHAELETGGGEIQVADSTLEGRVATGGGTVLLSRVRGGLSGQSGSGPVIRADPPAGSDAGVSADLDALEVDAAGRSVGVVAGRGHELGRLQISKAGGQIQLAEAPAGAIVATGGGRIDIGRAAGLVEATTGGGGIRIGPVAGSVHAETGAGDVEVTLVDAGGEPQSVEIRSGKGRVTLRLPAGFGGSVELETAYTRNVEPTRITVPWELQRSTTTWQDHEGWGEGTPRRYVRARGTVGDGAGRLKVKTVNGDIVIERAGG